MNNWKAVAGVVLGASLFFMAACEEEKELPKPRPLDPLVVCRNECRTVSEKMNQDCIDKLRAENAFDRLSECGSAADEYSGKCRAECDAKHAT